MRPYGIDSATESSRKYTNSAVSFPVVLQECVVNGMDPIILLGLHSIVLGCFVVMIA